MKVVCANDTYKRRSMDLTLGKAYEVHDLWNGCWYKIVNDRGALAWYDQEVVMPLDEWREKHLNELGI